MLSNGISLTALFRAWFILQMVTAATVPATTHKSSWKSWEQFANIENYLEMDILWLALPTHSMLLSLVMPTIWSILLWWKIQIRQTPTRTSHQRSIYVEWYEYFFLFFVWITNKIYLSKSVIDLSPTYLRPCKVVFIKYWLKFSWHVMRTVLISSSMDSVFSSECSSFLRSTEFGICEWNSLFRCLWGLYTFFECILKWHIFHRLHAAFMHCTRPRFVFAVNISMSNAIDIWITKQIHSLLYK